MKIFSVWVFIFLIRLNAFGNDNQQVLCSSTITACSATAVTASSAESTISEQASAFFSSLLNTESWPARWQCGTWSPFHGWLYIISDITIGFSYFMIPFILWFFLYKRKQQSLFTLVVTLFILFILSCGLTHFIDAAIFWWPAYRLSALLRFTTAVISLGTVIGLVKMAPRILNLKDAHELERLVEERTAELTKLNLEIQKLNEGLEQKVSERTAQLESNIRQLNESENKFAKAFQASAAGISITRLSDSRYLDVNDAFVRLIGYSREELIGHTSRELGMVVDIRKREEVLEHVRQHGASKNYEIAVRNKSGAVLSVLSSTETILLDGEKYAINIIYDITERKKAEENLELANKELESFSYSVSHDLRAPLRAISGHAQILEEDHIEKLDEDGVKALHTILRNSKRMGILIDDLLAFSKLGRKQVSISEIDMEGLVKSVLEEYSTEANYERTKISIKTLPLAKGDLSLIKQVWVNLISNAIKYSRNNPQPHVEIGAYEKDNTVVYYVKDNGAGFDMQYYDKLFGVFQRLHSNEEFEGTGIGLAIIQRIVQRHDGKVWAEAKPNEGACFYFSLP
jgi:PAS domain S-box-containing protein